MAITFTCVKCGHSGQAKDELAGRIVKCSKCGNSFELIRSQAVGIPTPPKPPIGLSSPQDVGVDLGKIGSPPAGNRRSEPRWLGRTLIFLLSCSVVLQLAILVSVNNLNTKVPPTKDGRSLPVKVTNNKIEVNAAVDSWRVFSPIEVAVDSWGVNGPVDVK